MIVLPGGWEGTYNLADDERVQNLLREFNAKEKACRGDMCCTICPNRAGVLKDEYTCYPSVEDEIKKDGYRDDKQVVVSQNIMTSRGPGTALCFGLEIVKRLQGEENYQAIKGGMLLDFCE